jgi:cell division protein FtsB
MTNQDEEIMDLKKEIMDLKKEIMDLKKGYEVIKNYIMEKLKDDEKKVNNTNENTICLYNA